MEALTRTWFCKTITACYQETFVVQLEIKDTTIPQEIKLGFENNKKNKLRQESKTSKMRLI